MTTYNSRDVQLSEHPLLLETVVGILTNCKSKPTKPWLHEIDQQTFADMIFNKAMTAIVDETFFVAYLPTEVAGMGGWYLQEIVFFRIPGAPKGDTGNIMRFLEDEAKALMCKGIIAGTGLQLDDSKLAALYQSHGYSPLSYDHFKPI